MKLSPKLQEKRDYMLGDLLVCLFDLASLKAQDKYIVNGTPKKYMTFIDIVEDYDSCLHYIYQNGKELFSQEELDNMQLLSNYIDKIDWEVIYDSRNSNHTIVYKYPAWVEMRQFAHQFLEFLGYSFNDFNEEGDLITYPYSRKTFLDDNGNPIGAKGSSSYIPISDE